MIDDSKDIFENIWNGLEHEKMTIIQKVSHKNQSIICVFL